MGRQVQDLIDKIKQEGLEAAEQKSQELELKAQKKADEIVAQAKKKAASIIENAKAESDKLEASAKTAVTQASRDMLLDLRKKIQEMLNKIILKETTQALTPEMICEVLKTIIKNSMDSKADAKIDIKLNPKDLDAVSNGVVAKLKEDVRKNIEIHASEDIDVGFTISFDAGKSSFEFTNQSLAEYLSIYLNPKVAELLKESSK
ncbi:MAG: hypothetical protein PHY73_00735 [Candidatus Omnitrophica bacterium]|nr:hypothetical protein [Candidatus Omnitrophota bacterium]